VSNWAKVLRDKNLRATPQRLVILKAMEGLHSKDHHRHVTARDVFEAVQETLPGLNVTTVYRTLEGLNQVGIVDLMANNKEQVRFSLRQSEHRHGHLVCKQCGQGETIDLAPIHSLAHQLQEVHGFVIDEEHMTLSGRCRVCLGGEPAEAEHHHHHHH
jgi:Fur family ferric uptake transcriptional regulator